MTFMNDNQKINNESLFRLKCSEAGKNFQGYYHNKLKRMLLLQTWDKESSKTSQSNLEMKDNESINESVHHCQIRKN